MTEVKLDYEECINSLLHGYMLHKASGVPSDAIKWMLNAQVAGWLREGFTTPSVASRVVIAFNQCMRLLRPLGDVESAIKLDEIPTGKRHIPNAMELAARGDNQRVL